MLSANLLTLALPSLALAATLSDFTDTAPLTWDYPPGRGFAADTATVYACGGIEPNGSRSSFPLSGGSIDLNVGTLLANLNILVVNQTDPTLFHAFSTYTNSVLDISVGSYCTPAPDFSKLDGYGDGVNVTFLAIYQLYGNDTYLYSCADVSLVNSDEYTAPASLSCVNSTEILQIAPMNDSLVLNANNFSAGRVGEDGQVVSIQSTPTATVATASPVYVTDAIATDAQAHGQTAAAASSSVASTAGVASASSTPGGTREAFNVKGQVGLLGLVAAMIAMIL